MSADKLERFWRKVDRTSSCWFWRGYVGSNGYGQVRVNGRMWLAHRFAYVSAKGEVPTGLCLDHLCRNRSCCNPDHLEPVSQRENTLRGNTLPAKNLLKTHCPHGHLYDEANTYLSKKNPNTRGCRTCRTAAVRRYQEKSIERNSSTSC